MSAVLPNPALVAPGLTAPVGPTAPTQSQNGAQATTVPSFGEVLAQHTSAPAFSRHALERLGESITMQETALLIGDLDEGTWQIVRGIMRTTGATSVESLKAALVAEEESAGTRRAADLVVEADEFFARQLLPVLETGAERGARLVLRRLA